MSLACRRAAAVTLMIWSSGLASCGRQAEQAQAPEPKAPVQTGVASFYSQELAGEPTATGEPMQPHAMTAASRSLPLGAQAKVTNLETGKSVTVEVNDRGPYAKGRIMDVTPKAAERLGFKDDGVAKVAVQPLAER